MSINFTIDTSILTKKNYDSEKIKDEEKRGRDCKQFEIIDNKDQITKSTKKEESEIQKPLWVKLNKNDFNSLIQDVKNNLNKNEFKTTINKKVYDLKNVQKFLVKITTQKISEKEACKLCFNLITPDINELKNPKGKSKNKRNKILDILENLESVFTGTYSHYGEVQSESEESIAKRIESIKKKIG